ncbi:MAG TPA: DinB family protein [Thermoanaerobaculia bacterium]|nr:DinB family protein [Thermoanaerobaculia bacterium]
MRTPRRTLAPAVAALFCLLIAGMAGLARADEKKPAAPMAAAAPASGFRADFLFLFDDVAKKLTDLAQAMPAEKYGWRPAEGVRSVGEVYAHIAGANFFIPKAWGAEPELGGVDIKALQTAATDKGKVTEALSKSLANVRHAVERMSDADLDRPIDLFGHKATVRAAVLVVGNHMHEHLGQSIAYARMNGVVPPWTAAEEHAAPRKP